MGVKQLTLSLNGNYSAGRDSAADAHTDPIIPFLPHCFPRTPALSLTQTIKSQVSPVITIN